MIHNLKVMFYIIFIINLIYLLILIVFYPTIIEQIKQFEEKIKLDRESIERKFDAKIRMIKKRQQYKKTKACTNQPNYNKDLFYIKDVDYTGVSEQIEIGRIKIRVNF